MSLDFNYKNVKDKSVFLQNPDDEEKSDWTWQAKAMPYLAMAIGIGEITEANALEFYTRVHIWERAVAPLYRNGNGEPMYITYEDVKNFIGMTTNVFPKESRTTFIKKIERSVQDDIRWPARIGNPA